jgi:hypothetical protein
VSWNSVIVRAAPGKERSVAKAILRAHGRITLRLDVADALESGLVPNRLVRSGLRLVA